MLNFRDMLKKCWVLHRTHVEYQKGIACITHRMKTKQCLGGLDRETDTRFAESRDSQLSLTVGRSCMTLQDMRDDILFFYNYVATAAVHMSVLNDREVRCELRIRRIEFCIVT